MKEKVQERHIVAYLIAILFFFFLEFSVSFFLSYLGLSKDWNSFKKLTFAVYLFFLPQIIYFVRFFKYDFSFFSSFFGFVLSSFGHFFVCMYALLIFIFFVRFPVMGVLVSFGYHHKTTYKVLAWLSVGLIFFFYWIETLSSSLLMESEEV